MLMCYMLNQCLLYFFYENNKSSNFNKYLFVFMLIDFVAFIFIILRDFFFTILWGIDGHEIVLQETRSDGDANASYEAYRVGESEGF